MKRFIFILIGLNFLVFASEAGESILSPSVFGPHQVGYVVRNLQDASRGFGELPSRTIALHLWYPAAPRADSRPMNYQEYVWAARGGISGRAEILAAYKANAMERDADAKVLDAYLSRPVRAVFDAPPAAGRRPLILYAPSINSDPFENAEIFEMLASRGYVVASAPCAGWEQPETERNVRGALAQWADLGFLLNVLWGEPFIDQERVGVLGFSWGGMTGLEFALSRPGIKAVAVLDGAQSMAAYRPVAESWPLWQPRRLRPPVLTILPQGEERDAGFFAQTLYADTFVWRIPGIVHRDFSSDFIIQRRRAAGDPKTPEIERTYSAIAEGLNAFFDSRLKDDAAARTALAERSASDPGWSMRPALPAPPSPAQFLRIIENDGVEAAVAVFRRLRQADPGVILCDEPRILEYAMLWGPERSDDLLKLLRMNLEMFPRSADTHFWLAQVYLAKNDKTAALKSLEAALAIDRNHAKALKLKKMF